MHFLPEVEQDHTYVQVCLSNKTSIVGVLLANQTASGCYVIDLTTVAKRLGLPSLLIAEGPTISGTTTHSGQHWGSEAKRNNLM
jgi:hypothetical protein